MLYQQGDVLIELVEEIPSEAKKCDTKGGSYVLAEGEVTGHSHTVDSGVATLLETKDSTGKRNGLFMEVFGAKGAGVVIKHQEHKKIKVPNGKYRVRQVREYDHFEGEARHIRD